MKKIVFAVLAVIVSIGIIIIATVGFNVDITYSNHDEARIYIGKEYNQNEVNQIIKEVMQNEKIIIKKVEKFNDSLVVKAKNISNEQVESLKQKIGEKYQIEDKTNIVTVSKVGNTRIRDLVKPYILPIIISTAIILAFMAIKYKKVGSMKVVLLQSMTLIIAAGLFLSVLAITRCPINKLFIPAGLTIYVLTLIATNIGLTKQIEILNNKKEKNA